MNDEYIIGGTFPGYICIPNYDSFCKFVKKDYNGFYHYLDRRIDDKSLILLQFPAYFALENHTSSKECMPMWYSYSKDYWLECIKEIKEECVEKITALENLEKAIEKI